MNAIEKKDRRKLLFYICGVAFPVVQFLIFYVFINFNSILLAFKEYKPGTEVFTISLENFFMHFTKIWNDVFHNASDDVNMGLAFLNAMKYYFASILIASTLNILFSNYIYKKNLGHKFFQIMLFIPKILSVSVLCLVYKYFVTYGIHDIVLNVFGKDIGYLMTGSGSKFGFIMTFALWSGFGTAVLIYTSTMSGIPKEVVESAELDGITPFKELIHITMPMIYPTFVTFMIVNFAAIFTNEMSLYLWFEYSFRECRDDLTIGYYLFAKSYMANIHGLYGMNDLAYVSSLGIILSAIAIPLTFLIKWTLEKFGPSFE